MKSTKVQNPRRRIVSAYVYGINLEIDCTVKKLLCLKHIWITIEYAEEYEIPYTYTHTYSTCGNIAIMYGNCTCDKMVDLYIVLL